MAMDRQTIIDLLSAFGVQEAGKPWPDYAGCGFTAADAPLLATLVADENLSNADADSNEVWIPLHAWRALLPLMPAGLQELLPALQVLDEDDWASVELPQVFAAAGAVAIAPLQAFIRDDAHAESARGLAVDALAEIARRDTGLRGQVLAALVERLQASTENDAWVNGCIVSALVDQEAVEAIDVIREAYALDKVDISFCGDVEEVEMELGLRTERDTPRPEFGWFPDSKVFLPPSLEPVDKAMSGEEWEERILQFLNFYRTEASLETVDELLGFFTAIGCSPEPIHPAEWLPEIWGGDEFAPEWLDARTVQVFFELIMPLYNLAMQELQDIDHFTIPFARAEVEGVECLYFSSWCNGFLYGVNIGDFPVMAIPGVLPLLDVLMDVTDNDLDSFGMSAAEITRKERHLSETVRQICRLGRGEQVAMEPIVHTEPKVGRNDPCPCGSGKKYKKCCLH